MRRNLNIVIIAAALALVFAATAAAQEEYKEGIRLFKARQYKEALDVFKQVTEDYQEWHFGHFMLGKCYAAVGDFNKAVTALKTSFNYADKDQAKFDSNVELAVIHYENLKDYKNAMAYATTALKLAGNVRTKRENVDNLNLIKGFCQYNLGQYSESIATFKPFVDAGTASANVLKAVAKSYEELNQSANAIATIQQVVRKDPGDLSAHKILVKNYVNSKQWNNAVQAANDALRTHSNDWELNYLKGYVLYQQNNLAGALDSLTAAIRQNPSAHYVHKMVGDIHAKRRDWEKAANSYRLAEGGKSPDGKAYKEDPRFYFSYAFAWYSFVPADAEKYHQTQYQQPYETALQNARLLLDKAVANGYDASKAQNLTKGITNKMDRLQKGAFDTVVVEGEIDPETGEIIWKDKGGEKKDREDK